MTASFGVCPHCKLVVPLEPRRVVEFDSSSIYPVPSEAPRGSSETQNYFVLPHRDSKGQVCVGWVTANHDGFPPSTVVDKNLCPTELVHDATDQRLAKTNVPRPDPPSSTATTTRA